MKASSMLTLPFLLLFAFLINLPLLAFSDDDEPVLDTDGNPMFTVVNQYFIVPASRGPHGGLTFGPTGTSKCPVTVLQDFYRVNSGVPVIFSPWPKPYGMNLTIVPGLAMRIDYAETPNCASSSSWSMFGDKNLPDEMYFTGIGSKQDNPDITKEETTTTVYFIIRKSVNGYKLMFCNPACEDLGLYDKDEGGRRLVMPTENAFEVNFEKYNGPKRKRASKLDENVIRSIA